MDLPIICSTDNEFASSVELYIKDGRNLIGLMICVAKYGLHALEFSKLVDLQCSLGHGIILSELGVEFGVNTSPINVLFLRCLSN